MKKTVFAIVLTLVLVVTAFAGEMTNSQEPDSVNNSPYVYVDNRTDTVYSVDIANGTVNAGPSVKSSENGAAQVAEALQKTGGKIM